jgi:hypothetical protein
VEDQPPAEEVRRLLGWARGRLGQARPLKISFVAALVLGAVIRLAALPLPGTHDVAVWKIWSYVAAREGVARLYGVGGTPPERRLVSFHGATTTVDYPPLALAELALTGRVYRWLHHGEYPDDERLIVAVKGPALVADVCTLLVLYFGVRRLAGDAAARWVAIAYWLNPAMLLDAACLGYLDPLFILPAIASVIAAACGWPIAAGALAGAAVLTKPQAVILAPALVLAAWGTTLSASALVRAALGAVAAVVGGLLPVVRVGALPNFLQTMGRLGQHDMLSGNACNLWWIVGYVMRAAYSIHDMGAWAAFTAPTKILTISRVVELGYPNPRPIGALLTAIAAAWALWTARRARDVWLAAALAAFLMHAYATLSAQVHENHLVAAVPLLALAAAGRCRFAPIFVAVSAIVALNLNLFYGISEDLGYAIPRGLTIVDLTVVVAIANCGVLAWHAARFRSECSTAAGHRLAPAPASHPTQADRSRSSESCT